MSEVRARIADRVAGEILEYVFGEILPSVTVDDQLWAALTVPDQAMTAALGGFERGEISYPELEAAGTEYVEAWQAQAERCRAGSGLVLVPPATASLALEA